MRDDQLEVLACEAEEQEAQAFTRRRRRMEDFRYDEQQEKYWDITTGILLGPKSVDGAIPRDLWPTRPDARSGQPRPEAPSKAINNVDTGLTVEGSTWWPGKPPLIPDVVINERGAAPQKGAVCYNAYIPPDHDALRDDRTPEPWIEHVKRLWPDPLEHKHFFDFCAHMLQRPDEKINHGIVMAGAQGIGKDTAMYPLRKGVGEWNAAEVEPDAISRQYNGYIKSVMLVINEVRPHDEDHRASNFYNQLKPLLAAPPDMMAMEMKYANAIYVRNLCHVILTTNDPLTMYIPAEDRRLFVMTSPLPSPMERNVFPENYFQSMYDYLEDGGADAVVKWLLKRPLVNFRKGTAPPVTTGKKMIAQSSKEVRRSVIDDIYEIYSDQFEGEGSPTVIFLKDLLDFAARAEYFDDRETVMKILRKKNLHFKMAEKGYDMVTNPAASEWRSGKFRSRVAFIKKEVPQEERCEIIRDELCRRPLTFGAADDG